MASSRLIRRVTPGPFSALAVEAQGRSLGSACQRAQRLPPPPTSRHAVMGQHPWKFSVLVPFEPHCVWGPAKRCRRITSPVASLAVIASTLR